MVSRWVSDGGGGGDDGGGGGDNDDDDGALLVVSCSKEETTQHGLDICSVVLEVLVRVLLSESRISVPTGSNQWQ